MSIKVALNHKTSYKYDKPVMLSPHVIRLRPALHTRTPITAYTLKVTPKDHYVNWQQDTFGNFQARYIFKEKTTELTVEVELVANMVVVNPFDFYLDNYVLEYPFTYDESILGDLSPYMKVTDRNELVDNYIRGIDFSIKGTVDFLVALNRKLQQDIYYTIRMEPGIQSTRETLTSRQGSCRDTSWLLIQILRSIGFAARFTSGYLIQLAPDIKPIDGPAGPEKDFTDLHAWAEVYLPGAGWVGLDPTSGLFAGEGHIPLACTPEPSTASPITGYTEKANVDFGFEMSVKRIKEIPRVTKPYTEEQWESIYLLGKKIDKQLVENDVRLSMGGEPTFVSVDDMEGAEWNTDALGPTKKFYASNLFYRLKEKYGKGGLLHYGQGKWYPGESLPRWALTCYWRKDGVPIWENPDLFGNESINYGYTFEDAQRFIQQLSKNLDITSKHIQSAFEDVYYYLWKEGTLPVNQDPFKVKLDDPEERKTLRKVLEQGLDKIVGYAMPLKWDYFENKWGTGPWFFKRERMYLLPGDSPMGFRLPLKSLVHSEKEDFEVEWPFFEGSEPLKNFQTKTKEKAIKNRVQTYLPLKDTKEDKEFPVPGYEFIEMSPDYLTRTALCVEPRQGNLYVFVPPLTMIEHYLELMAAIEKTCLDLGLKVLIEGYNPPSDSRVQSFSITPDPGVIEVNIHPSTSWDELVEKTETLYYEARWSRLGAEKFMIDGRHTGTGGGNHVTIGGPTPADSPILRRPDLLKSLIAYWHNHPSLSYLFSGLFLGPTSQAPRIDEARHDTVNEIEIAFNQIQQNQYTSPWLVDRLLRNLLTDLTGNTHRAEFCIDKLYSPDGYSGRKGLLEMRAFEMPPHFKMSVAQTLLIRALVARFWDAPYNASLVKWGNQIHDKFMLPHFIKDDFNDIIQDLNSWGFEFDLSWYDTFFSFRFPIYGTVQIGNIHIELRMALEPWPVLGEEVAAGGMARYVDSSVERLQIRIFGATNTRHIVTCNSRMIPLKPTGVNGEFVAGIKYKAWAPPSALHPTIPIHTPLVIDVVDTWNNKSIGGCTYHVMHPGGRGYDTFPVNANEAEARRISRFFSFGHTPGAIFVNQEEINKEFPYTLDLRK
ncbi:MAG: transglutaminase family protein [Leptospiraceae bacterium]|nr:transglutaminase family protein [Leptospiraceae bacterium]MCP5495976.1 transglutaminase family protein [Leptospiraceae bacterium]